MSSCIFLDYQSTTPLDPRVRAAMQPYLEDAYGNPHSEHAFGWKAAEAVENAADSVADLIGANPGEITFTSGATEANNLAIQGIARSDARRGNHILVSAIEHKCVLNTALALRKYGFEVDVIPVDQTGIIDIDRLESALRQETALVSVMHANNEIGTIQPVAEIGNLCRERNIPFHTDAAQTAGKIPVDVNEIGADMVSLSAHKMYGPKGIGGLYVSRSIAPELEPLIYGGAQQNGLRAGTLPPFLCAGFGEACQISSRELEQDLEHSRVMSEAFRKALREQVPEIRINGHAGARLPGNLNVQFPGIDAESLLTALHGRIAASTGSACNAGLIEPSYVLLALGLNYDEIKSSVRFGFGRMTTMSDIEYASHIISGKIKKLSEALAVA